MTNETRNTLEYMEALADEHFWGFLSIKYEDGKIVHIRREENLRPNELPGRNRNYERNNQQQR